jgi:uncharacterized membrane protein
MATINVFLGKKEIERINASVTAAEKNTAGEIKILVVQNSSSFSGKTPEERAEIRGNEEFFELGLDHTKDNTGILIMISLDERRVVVRAGKAINDHYDQKTWQGIVDTVISGIKDGSPEKGICESVMKVGKILSRHFPIRPDDINEIPDEIIFKE